MTKIGLLFGTQTGNTEAIAEVIQTTFGSDTVTLHKIANASPKDGAEYSPLMVDCLPWNIGELQAD